ncbi:MAG: biliverdin-producing heme oxygenase [Burkholderiales bacterium]
MTAEALTARLRSATRPLHAAAERAGLMGALLAGRADRAGYASLLRNLHALYAALERALRAHDRSPLVGPLAMPALSRTDALRTDLDAVGGAGWSEMPIVPAMCEYVAHVDALARREPARLGAHAYVRYLGDLNGGQALREVVQRALPIEGGRGLAFYDFGPPQAVDDLAHRFRRALDALPLSAVQADAFVAEAKGAFERHIRVFEELARP